MKWKTHWSKIVQNKNKREWKLFLLVHKQPQEVFHKMFLKLLQNSQENICVSLFFNKVAGVRPEETLWHCCFPVNFAKFLKAPFL